jgi:uncharacterized LabA/DUF88 family protein
MANLKHRSQRVLVLFDVQNMYYSAKHLFNAKVNFKTILETAIAGRTFVRAIAYTIRAQIKEEQSFYDALENIGIEVKVKDLQIFYTGDKKGDWDIGIAMDAVRLQSKVDTIVLVSGDGDFKDLMTYLKSHGCRVEVIAFAKTASKFLKEEADDFIDLGSNPMKFLRKSARPVSRAPQRAVPLEDKPIDPEKAVPHETHDIQKIVVQQILEQPKDHAEKEKDLKISEESKHEAEKPRFASRLRKLIRRPKE